MTARRQKQNSRISSIMASRGSATSFSSLSARRLASLVMSRVRPCSSTPLPPMELPSCVKSIQVIHLVWMAAKQNSTRGLSQRGDSQTQNLSRRPGWFGFLQNRPRPRPTEQGLPVFGEAIRGEPEPRVCVTQAVRTTSGKRDCLELCTRRGRPRWANTATLLCRFAVRESGGCFAATSAENVSPVIVDKRGHNDVPSSVRPKQLARKVLWWGPWAHQHAAVVVKSSCQRDSPGRHISCVQLLGQSTNEIPGIERRFIKLFAPLLGEFKLLKVPLGLPNAKTKGASAKRSEPDQAKAVAA